MTQPQNPNSLSSHSGGQAKPSVATYYQHAVAALKAGQYDQALAQFQQLERLPPTSPYRTKALMGQVLVYQHLAQPVQVRSLCQRLLKHPSPSVGQWAQQVLDQLPKVGTVPSPKSSPAATPPSPAQAGGNLWVPERTTADLSGFTPLSGDSVTSPPPAVPPVPSSAILDQPREPAPPPPEDLAADPGEDTGVAAGSSSLFHYQQLNQPDQTESGVQPASPPPAQVAIKSHSPRSAPPSGFRKPPSHRPQPPLPARPLGLWVAQGLTAIALLWAINWAVHFAIRTTDQGLRWIRWPVQLSLPGGQQSYTPWILAGLILLALASPWLLDAALSFWYRQKPLSTRQLHSQHSEALRLLRQVCRQQGWQLPELRLIADSAPLCFSYGWLPRNIRIVISQGLLDQCSEETLKTLYGYELARMVNGSLPVSSAVGLLLLLLHTAYYRLAQAGDNLPQPLAKKGLGLLASAFYGLFWLLRQGVLWLSRRCCWWGDRRTVALTQRPDQLAAGLLDLTQAIATYLERHGSLHPLHTSLEVLMPVSSRQAVSPGSLITQASEASFTAATLMTTDGLNPYRQWLQVNASHIPLGERFLEINRQAQLRGQPAIELTSQPTRGSARVSPALLFLQKGPLAGVLVGGGLAMGLWFLGGIVNRLGWQRLSWLYQDPSILWGGLWLGLGVGLLIRINALFPDGNPVSGNGGITAAPAATIVSLMQHTATLPVYGHPITLHGQLKGLPGLGNWGCQALYIEDASGIVRLFDPVPLSSLQSLGQGPHPRHWLGRQVTVIGWGRYGGGMLWVDIHQVQLDARQRFTTQGPLWATVLSLVISLVGIGIIFSGG
jgi:Zn-dependent protease with chaperone function